MYILMKTEFKSGVGNVYVPAKRSENLDELCAEIQKRVADGCAFDKLHIVKEIEFDILCNVKFKE